MSIEPIVPARKSRFGTRDRLETFGSSRTCAAPDCSAVLSRYNADDVCGAHSEERSAAY